MRKTFSLLVSACILAFGPAACEKGETTSRKLPAGVQVAAGDPEASFDRLFVLNEGLMGYNQARLDLFRTDNGHYISDAFGASNPSLALGLGDTGNDLKINGNTVWAVLTGSGLVEVADARSLRHLAAIPVPDPRQVCFDASSAYVSSYNGAIYGGAPVNGKVYRIDLASRKVTAEVEVGEQPEGLAVVGGKLYVANSGGYSVAKAKTVSVIELEHFTVEKTLDGALNVRDVLAAGNDLWLFSQGNWVDIPSGLYCLDTETGLLRERSGDLSSVRASSVALAGSVIYTLYAEWNTGGTSTNYLYTYDITADKASRSLFSGDMAEVRTPYALAVDAAGGDLYIGDSLDSKLPGLVWCFTPEGKRKWKTTTGICPGHFAFWKE